MNDWTIDIRIEKNHLITEIDGKLLLLDSGAPHSFGRCKLEWEGEQVDLSTQMPPMPFSILQERIGLPLDGLIGCNHLLHRGMRLDIPNSTLTLHDEVPCDADACALHPIMNVPAVTMDVGGIPQKIIIDTGAMQTFVSKKTALLPLILRCSFQVMGPCTARVATGRWRKYIGDAIAEMTYSKRCTARTTNDANGN